MTISQPVRSALSGVRQLSRIDTDHCYDTNAPNRVFLKQLDISEVVMI